jgi:NAD(P)-dependent dehydrogenase (short-subunit alcohol dehydrogenase family)
VLLVDIDEGRLQEAVDTLGGDQVSFVAADVTNPEQMQRALATTVKRYRGLDIRI